MAKENNETMKSKNEVIVAGYLKEINLEQKKNSDKEDVLQGFLTIQYGDKITDQATVKVWKKKFTKEGNVAKAYEKLVELMNNHVLVGQEGEATTVKIYGNGDFTPSLGLNEYCPEGGDIVSRPEVSMGFGNIAVNTVDEKQFKGEFDLVVYLTKDAKMEKDKEGDETGRLMIEGLYITHKNEVKPLSFMVEDEEVVEAMSDLSKGQTIEIWGNIQIAKITEVKSKKSGFGGKAKTDETVTTISELIITGGEEVEEDDKRCIEASFVKKALVERDTFLEDLRKNGAEKESKPKSKGFKSDKKPSNSDIPF